MWGGCSWPTDETGLMRDHSLEVHLEAAEQFYREDRLDRALEAYGRAMTEHGWAGGGWAGFYNEVVWEKAARDSGQVWELSPDLSIEIPRDAPPQLVANAKDISLEARKRVRDLLDYEPRKPVLVTVLPRETPLEFIPGPYGYLAEKSDIHKICIPYNVLQPREDLLETLVHEYTHAAEHDLSEDRCPRWLAEGISMYLSGELDDPGVLEELRHAVERYGLVPLWRVNGLISAWSNRDIEDEAGYTFSASLVLFMVERFGREGPGRLLRAVAERSLNAAFKSALGVSRRKFELEWRQELARKLRLPFNPLTTRLKIMLGG